MSVLQLQRFAYAPEPFGTFGQLWMPGGDSLYTVERSWSGNAVGRSCIPEGRYPLRLRPSGVVERTSHGAYAEGWEVAEVPGRSLIMLHIANTPSELQGCIGVGLGLSAFGRRWAVRGSREAFHRLMRALAAQEDWELVITPRRVEFP